MHPWERWVWSPLDQSPSQLAGAKILPRKDLYSADQNVSKSSLLNNLLREEKAIVTDRRTARDVIRIRQRHQRCSHKLSRYSWDPRDRGHRVERIRVKRSRKAWNRPGPSEYQWTSDGSKIIAPWNLKTTASSSSTRSISRSKSRLDEIPRSYQISVLAKNINQIREPDQYPLQRKRWPCRARYCLRLNAPSLSSRKPLKASKQSTRMKAIAPVIYFSRSDPQEITWQKSQGMLHQTLMQLFGLILSWKITIKKIVCCKHTIFLMIISLVGLWTVR